MLNITNEKPRKENGGECDARMGVSIHEEKIKNEHVRGSVKLATRTKNITGKG